MFNFCTLFDKNYLFKGLALYNSLSRHCREFTLWVLCMDSLTYEILDKMALKNVSLIRHQDFEDNELLEVKPTRSIAEYCWTCTPSLPLYIFRTVPTVDMITYLDADLFFYGDPEPVYREFGGNSIMIIEHRFPPHLKHLEIYGIYNVQMMAFRNDSNAIDCLKWWRDRCIDWCYKRAEDGKLGDQKYLDDWPVRFNGVHVLQHKGAGVALWNVMRYKMEERGGKVFVDDVPLVFYHFHNLDLLYNNTYDFGDKYNYNRLGPEVVALIYQPYVVAIEEAIRKVRGVAPSFNYGFKRLRKGSLVDRALNAPANIAGRLMGIGRNILRRK